jgi:hypothetical protein
MTELCWSSLAGVREIKGLGTLSDRIVLVKFSGKLVDSRIGDALRPNCVVQV